MRKFDDPVSIRIGQLKAEGKKIISPSLIIGLEGCARKSFYKNIMKLPEDKNKYLVGGTNAHTVVETFVEYYKSNPTSSLLTSQAVIEEIFNLHWDVPRELGLNDKEREKMRKVYLKKCQGWLNVWHTTEKGAHIITEEHVINEDLMLHGFIDRKELFDNEIWITDMKTSKDAAISNKYKLQLLYYILMDKWCNPTNKKYRIFLDFFDQGKLEVPYDNDDLEIAKDKALQTHKFMLEAGQDIKKYPRGFDYCASCPYKDRCFQEG